MPIIYSGPQTFAPGDLTTISVIVDTGAAEAGRIVLLACKVGNPTAETFVSGSFGGVTTSLLTSTTGNTDEVYLFAAVVPDGAGNQTCTITFTNTIYNVVVGAWVIRGAAFPAEDADAATDASFPFAPVIPLTVSEGAAVFVLASANSGTTATLSFGSTTLTRTIQADSGGVRSVHFGDATDLAAGTANFSQSSNLCFSAGVAAFAPAASGDPDITGTLAAQESGTDVAAFAAAVDIGLVIAAQETGADSASFDLGIPISVTGAAQEAGGDTASGSASVAVAGAVAAQEAGGDAAPVSGVVAVSGALAAQESGADRAVIQAGSGRIATLAAQENGSDQATGAAVVGIDAELGAQELGGDIASVIVSIEDNVITVNLAARETGPDVGSGAAAVAIAGTALAQEQGADGTEILSNVVILASAALSETGPDRASIVVQNSVPIPSARRAATPAQSANGGRLTVTANGGRLIQSRNGGRLV